MNDKSSFHARCALVTGASGAIGGAVARRLAKDGFRIAVCFWQSETKAQALKTELLASHGEGIAEIFQADLSQKGAAEDLFSKVHTHFGRVDALFNNAGATQPGPLASLDDEAYERVFATNTYASFALLRQAARQLADHGRIVSTSSTVVSSPILGSSLYAASKAGLELLTIVSSKELAARAITANALRVGPTVPGLFELAPAERRNAMAAAAPFKRLGQPNDTADVVAFLMSEAGAWITGQVITVDGGITG
ncbi:SDR family oxidoreductase [Rhizobium leguminosarum]|uniref:SDR family oxidoreductase n=1 Tax=Rhizobium leguminosarum TaxID=384 RepID=UPI001C94C856|nr:SDR family oxidoreductase [Rhizobium leguminosarum]MBY5775262.1 SDR family oxidoreductase [Rhizobium leguminosarum]